MTTHCTTSRFTHTRGLMGLFTPKGVRNLSAKKDLEVKDSCLYLWPRQCCQSNFNSLIMSDVRINLLKEVKSAVNTASFAPTADRIAEAKHQVELLMLYVESLQAPPKRKASKKRKQKAGKATPSTRVADRQERAFHGKADSPVTPSTRKPKADVEAARKSAEAVSRHTGAESRAKRKAEAMVEAVSSSHDERVASLEAKIDQLTNTLAVLMDDTSHHTANEVSFSDLPFDPTSTL